MLIKASVFVFWLCLSVFCWGYEILMMTVLITSIWKKWYILNIIWNLRSLILTIPERGNILTLAQGTKDNVVRIIFYKHRVHESACSCRIIAVCHEKLRIMSTMTWTYTLYVRSTSIHHLGKIVISYSSENFPVSTFSFSYCFFSNLKINGLDVS